MATHQFQKSPSVLAALVAVVALPSAVACQEARANPNDIELKGPLTELSGACPNLQFSIGAQKVVTQATTKFSDGACPDVREGARVEVDGTIGADRVLVAREVELE